MGNQTVCGLINTIQQQLLTPVARLLLVLGVLVFIYGVVEFVAQASNEEARTKGKNHMIWGIIGLVIILGVGAIITIIRNFFGGSGLAPFCVNLLK